jgi:hypothetical protein
MRTCIKCDRPLVARRLCNKHYLAERKEGVPASGRAKPRELSPVEELARAGENLECIDCGDVPLFGGLRCLHCFRARCDERSKFEARPNR